VITWFDEEKMKGNIRQTMSDALDETLSVIVFITREYEKKINSNDNSDNCYFEFSTATDDSVLVNRCIPVVMDPSMTNPRNWQKGRLKSELRKFLYIDMTEDKEEVFQEKCDDLVKRIQEVISSGGNAGRPMVKGEQRKK
jgi:hypothetical protein